MTIVQQWEKHCLNSRLFFQMLLIAKPETPVALIIDREDSLFQHRVKEAFHIRRVKNFNKDQGLAVSNNWNGLELWDCASPFVVQSSLHLFIIISICHFSDLCTFMTSALYILVTGAIFVVLYQPEEDDHTIIKVLQKIAAVLSNGGLNTERSGKHICTHI